MTPRIAQRASRQLGLAVPEEPFRSVLVARLRRTTRWSIGSFATGFAAAIVIGLMLRVPHEASAVADLLWLGVGGALLAGSVGAILAVLTEARPTASAGPRVARAAARRMRDYVDPFELGWVRVTAVLGLGLPLVNLALHVETLGGPTPTTALVLGAAGIVELGILEGAGRRIVLGRGRITSDETELAWDDALRASDLRRLTSAVAMTSIYAVVFAGFPLIGAGLMLLPTTAASVLVNVTAYLAFAGAIIALVVALRRDSPRHYLRVLWPELAAQRVAAPYAPTPAERG